MAFDLLPGRVGIQGSQVVRQDLGQAGRIEASQKELFVIKGGGDGPAIRDQISALQSRLDTLEADDDERDEVRLRLTRLSGNAGILKIGAHTKAERNVLHQKAEQGIKALAATLAEGVLPGGGIAYVRAAAKINPDQASHPDERMGMAALKQALPAPFFRILQNAHIPAPAVILNDVLASGADNVYDVMQGRICSARDSRVMDATKIIRQVLETAASGAIMALSVDVTVLKRRPVTNENYEP